MTPRRVLRITSIIEACTWAFLLVAMLFKYVINPDAGSVLVPFAGAAHGTAFLAYLFFGLVVGASARWSFGLMLVGGLASVPPFATLLFDWWVERSGRLPSGWMHRDADAPARGLRADYRGAGMFGKRLDGLVTWTLAHPVTLALIAVAAFVFILAPSLGAALRG